MISTKDGSSNKQSNALFTRGKFSISSLVSKIGPKWEKIRDVGDFCEFMGEQKMNPFESAHSISIVDCT